MPRIPKVPYAKIGVPFVVRKQWYMYVSARNKSCDTCAFYLTAYCKSTPCCARREDVDRNVQVVPCSLNGIRVDRKPLKKLDIR